MSGKTARLFLLCICISMGLYACRNGGTGLTEEDAQCHNFMLNDVDEYYSGKHHRLVAVADSYLTAQHDISPFCRMESYRIKARYYINSFNYPVALSYTDSVHYILDLNGLKDRFLAQYIEAYTTRGEINYTIRDFDAAYNDYFNAKELSKHIAETCASVTQYYGLGMISYKQKKYYDAIDYFRTTFLYAEKCSDKMEMNRMQEVLDNIALCYEKLNQPDSALYFYDSALRFISGNDGRFKMPMYPDAGKGVIYGNLGSIYLNKRMADTAVSYFKKSIAINLKPHYEMGDALITHIKLAKVYLVKNDMDNLVGALAAIHQELDTIHHGINAERDWNKLEYEYHKAKGDINEALKYHEVYSILQDSIKTADEKELRTDVSKAMNQKEQAYQIEILRKQNKLNDVYLWVAIIILVMAGIIIAQVYVSYKKGRKNIQALTALNNQVSEQKDQLEIKNREKDRILHVVAHDLRNPVGSVIFLSKEMQGENAADWANDDVFGLIASASESAMTLINELLGYTTAISTQLVTESADINKLVNDSIKLLQFKAGEKQQRIIGNLPGTPARVNINREQITRVLGNLLANAMKFSKAGTDIIVAVWQGDKTVTIAVKDQGIGIPEKHRGNVFNMFTDAKRSGTAGEKSFGLGLSICKQIVENHGGSIWFESEENKGTSFYIELPAC